MVIQHNISALNSHRNLGLNNSAISGNLEKLSSGYKINRAGDDAAGLAISEKMRGQIRGLAMAEQNADNGVSLIQTAEGGLSETHAILQRMRELAVQSANGTYQDSDRNQITLEYEALKSEIDRIAESTHYNGIKLLNGNLSSSTTVSVTQDMNGVMKDFTLGNITGAVKGDTLQIQLGTITVTAGSVAVADVMELDFSAYTLGVGNNAGEILTLKIGNAEYQVALSSDNMTGSEIAAQVAAELEKYSDGKYTVAANAQGGTDAGKVRLTATAAGKDSILDTLSVVASAACLSLNGTNTSKSVTGAITVNGVNATPDIYTMGTVTITNTTSGIYGAPTATAGISTGGAPGYAAVSISATYNAKNNTWVISDTAGTTFTLDASKIPMDENAKKITFDVIVTEGDNLVFQIGANGGQDQRVNLNIEKMDSNSIGLRQGDTKSDGTTAISAEAEVLATTSVETRELANKAIEVITAATDQVSAQRAQLGALQNRLEHTLNNLGVTKENLTAAESSIRDVDMAKEMMEFTKNNILVQASQAMLAQANQLPQGVLSLLR